jgi:aryl-alcohol dehydrogenase-like predicted oxidoreductase
LHFGSKVGFGTNHGLSELRLGRFLRQRDRGSFTVSTKVGRILVPPRGESFDRGIWAAPLELKPVFDDAFDELVPEAARRGTAVVAAAVFNSGVLAAARGGLSSSTYFYRPASDAITERVSRLAEVCAKHGVPIQAAALQFPLANPTAAAVIVGMNELEQVDANVAWAQFPIPAAVWDDLRAAGLLRADLPTGVLAGPLFAASAG